MSERIAHRELRNKSGEVLRAVSNGATFEVTNHGRVVAVISPPGEAPGELHIIRATRRGDWAALTLHPTTEPTAAVLDELREDTV